MPEQVVRQRSRGFICVNAHPAGCAANVERQIAYVRERMRPDPGSRVRNALVLGSSAGYGLASGIVTAWGLGHRTLGLFLERPPKGRRTATAGYYNSVALHKAAERDGLWVRSINADAYSDEAKDRVAQLASASMGKFDLVIYSLASPKRVNPRTGVAHSSSLRSIGSKYTGKTIDLARSRVTTATVKPATEDEIANTVAVMGGEDWRWWIERLLADGLLAEGARTLAYTYYGPRVTWPVYRDGTIGAAKGHLKETADALDQLLRNSVGGGAWLSVNKAVVTQASTAIPIVPLYVSLLFRVMKEQGIHEGCIEQIVRLVKDHLVSHTGPSVDADRLIRLDDLEMREDVQNAVADLWPRVNTETLASLSDYDGFKREFSSLFGFDVEGVDYDLPVETEILLDPQ
ncbi:MAG: trans-2-enoyl-CoA reductase family protein [Bryobacterales bacterium]|nr:trans-2-enoyl-CoA reductase family protein [Bryobacterales bacterium]MDE0626844.1 trans-2-enoyl-CoA reductase family protein [Bryobacterales bacterium]